MIVKYVSLLGHKNHGKSTLIGSLLIQTKSATQIRINEAKMYSDRLGKPFGPAFILDSFAEEREGEMTYDTTRAEVKYKNLAFSFIDVPGHEELIKNMISGASYGEVALLLVSAKRDEGIKDQTRRHLFIAKLLGMEKLIVAVNKMDAIGYERSRFEEMEKELLEFILRIGFLKKNVHFVPISAYKGENLVKKSSNMKWYKGGTLIDNIYRSAMQKADANTGALRIVIQGFVDEGDVIVGGNVVSGKLREGQRVSILPKMQQAIVKRIIVKGKKVKSADAGENVAIKLDRKPAFELRGTFICGAKDVPALKDSIQARMFITGRVGKNLKIKFNGEDVGCNNIRVIHVIDTTTGRVVAGNKAQVLNAIDAGLILTKKLPFEKFEATKELGRFTFYSDKKFAGFGIVV